MGQGLSVGVDDLSGHCLCKADIKPWLFSKKKGSKSLDVEDGKIDIFWDLSGAKFGAGPEPVEGFYVAVVFDLELVLLLGDMKKDAYRKTGANRSMLNAAFVARREHIYGEAPGVEVQGKPDDSRRRLACGGVLGRSQLALWINGEQRGVHVSDMPGA
uniref:Uncharacterized protein n=1 Tax=Zea mays TaxID=4577 RepID=C0PEV9_MAIZE|nr:unknown [Zea mays]